MENKKALVFSTDALIALMIIFMTIVVALPILKYSNHQSYVEKDVIGVLSNLKIGEINNSYVQSLRDQGMIKDPNKTILEQLGEFYVENESLAKDLASNVLKDLSTDENIGLLYNNNFLYLKNSSNYEDSKNVRVAKEIISGIHEGASVTGYSARAYLTSEMQTKYYYFGGYMGDGNITVNISYNGQLSNAVLEIAINKDFDLYINGNWSGHYMNSTNEYTPNEYDLSDYKLNFSSGYNTVKIVGNNTHIAGGYLKLTYSNSTNYEQPTRYYFPGIEGIINLYDGFYVPNTIRHMNILLHFNSNLSLYLNIGNKTVYNNTNNTSNNDVIVLLNDTNLSALGLNYSQISNTTIPIRFALQTLTGGGQGGNADVVLITDTSGSMDWRLDTEGSTGTARNCLDPSLTAGTTKRISLAKCLDSNFTSTVLSGTGNKVALVSFTDNADSGKWTNLSSNYTYLNNTISAYSASGSTCVACAINRAYLILQNQSSNNRKKFIIVMTDGVTNYRSTGSCYNLLSVSSYNILNPFSSSDNLTMFNRDNNGNWNIFQTLGVQVNSLKFFNSTWGFGVGNSGIIRKWNGSSWNNISSPTTDNLNSLDIHNSTFALAITSTGKVIKWNGTNWTSLVTITNSPALYSISKLNSSLWFTSGWYSNQGRIYKSTDSGNTWSLDYSTGNGKNYYLRGIKVINSTLAYSVGDSGNIYKWNGATWSVDSYTAGDDLYAIDYYNNSQIYAVGGSSGNSIIINNTKGGTWTSAYSNNLDGFLLRSVSIFNNTFYAVGDGFMIIEKSGNSFQRLFYPIGYQGNLTAGISCNDAGGSSCPSNSVLTSYPALNANYSSCRARNDLNSTIYSVGFGPVGTCSFANTTLQNIANCGNGSYYASTNGTALQQFYQNIALDILKISFSAQTSNASSGIISKLYPDSYIEFNYSAVNYPYGLVLPIEKYFNDNYTGTFNIPVNSTPIDARVVSYSGPLWTQILKINNNIAYNLSNFGNDYTVLGDPYSINIPLNMINGTYNNNINLTTGLSPNNYSQGSQYNKIIYRIVKNITTYTQDIYSKSEGCKWNITFEDGSSSIIKVPSNYSGPNLCTYPDSQEDIESSNNAMTIAVFSLLQAIDLNSNGKVDINFTNNNLVLSSSEITGIPYSWYTNVEVRTWD